MHPSSTHNRPFMSAVSRDQLERGQTTAEYALVLLAAGTIAMLVIAWAQDSNSIGTLFDAVLNRVTSLIA